MGAIHRRSERGWEGVVPQAYADAALAGVRKHELIGEAEGAAQYRIRFFEVPPHGRTARERHPHDHGVVIVSGRARVTLGEEQHEVAEGDVVYVAGDELHCFEALGDGPLGFLCVVGPRSPESAAPPGPRSSDVSAPLGPRSSDESAPPGPRQS